MRLCQAECSQSAVSAGQLLRWDTGAEGWVGAASLAFNDGIDTAHFAAPRDGCPDQTPPMPHLLSMSGNAPSRGGH